MRSNGRDDVGHRHKCTWRSLGVLGGADRRNKQKAQAQ
jgi:hypothetical protein